MKSIRFLSFTDLHHQPQVFVHDSASYLRSVMERAVRERASFIVQLGDLLHAPKRNGRLADVYNDFSIPTYNVFGNHDCDQEGYEYVLRMYRLERGYYSFDQNGYRFVVLDPNYVFPGHGSVHFHPNHGSSSKGYIPNEQLAWLERTIAETDLPCVIFSHQSLERSDGIVNRDDAWKILCAANRRRKRSVILCVNGHYHDDHCCIMNDVCCLDLNSVSYHWTDPENHLYADDVYERSPISRHCLYYKNPLSAVIEIENDSLITITGTDGSYLCPVSEEQKRALDQRRLSYERITVPFIRNYKIDLTVNTLEIG